MPRRTRGAVDSGDRYHRDEGVIRMSSSTFQELSLEECTDLLRARTVGRIAVLSEGAPLIFPVNYRLVETSAPTWLAVRTREGNVIDRASSTVAFEIDDVDDQHHEGWSVLVRGTLHHVDPDAADFRARFDPEPWIADERDAWLVIAPFSITGRRIVAPGRVWEFDPRAYL
jgi:nitroimidazol reductase NimA-like FMN-containing flavoprotein (pyridoxamine 5'-phosphate oxidase superfamily)